ncbi:MAG: hypothetical protein E7356_01250 [Clostridiales bacterium]|nr:hypothetical protein [Clostridiales bacterium]
MTSHSALFCNYYETGLDVAMNAACEVNWSNVNAVGNGEASQENIYSGAIILVKSYRVNSNFVNNVTNKFYINYLVHTGEENCANDGQFKIDYCKGYDAYQCLLFFNGAEKAIVSNSEFKRAAGPAIITTMIGYEDYVKKDATDYNITRLDIVNSTIESLVSGNEPWFKIYGAAPQFASVTALEAMLNGTYDLSPMASAMAGQQLPAGTIKTPGTDKSIFATTTDSASYMNMIVISMPDSISFDQASKPMLGYVRKFESQTDYENFYADSENTVDDEFGLYMGETGNLGQYSSQAITGESTIFVEDDVNYFSTTGVLSGTSFQAGDPEGLLGGVSLWIAGCLQSNEEMKAQGAALYKQAFNAGGSTFNLYLFNAMGTMIESQPRNK